MVKLKINTGSLYFGEKKKPKKRITQSIKNKIWDDQNGKCARCYKQLSPSTTEYHHIKHHSKGGTVDIENMSALCVSCHKIIHNEERIMEKRK